MFSIKPLRILPFPHQVFASDNYEVVIQNCLVNSLKENDTRNVSILPVLLNVLDKCKHMLLSIRYLAMHTFLLNLIAFFTL